MSKINRYKSIDALKLIAIITMIIDHSKFLFLDYNLALSFIGRISFITFSFILAFNLHQTFQDGRLQSLKNYLKNFLIFSVISEIPYQLLFKENTLGTLNIMVTLLFGFLLITFFRLIDKNKMFFIPFILVILISFIFNSYLEYGFLGVLLIFFFHLFFMSKNEIKKIFIMFFTLLLSISCNLQYYSNFIEIFGFFNVNIILIGLGSILGCFVSYFIYFFDLSKYKIPRIGKLSWWFYPIHMIFLFLILSI